MITCVPLKPGSAQEQAAEWISLFSAWHTQYQHLLKERTYARDHPDHRPRGITTTRVWWYTHDRLRKAYHAMNRPLLKGHLFAFLQSEFHGQLTSSTTNMIEGGINSGIREILRLHRGLPLGNRGRATEWYCWSHAGPTACLGLEEFISPHLDTPEPNEQHVTETGEDIGEPKLYDTQTTPEEGLWTRAGRDGHPTQTHF